MQKVKIQPKVRKTFEEFLVLTEAAREKSNEANRKKTEVKNVIKTTLEEAKAPFGSYFILDGHKIFFASSENEEITPEDLYAQFEEGHITKEQFLKCIKVGLAVTAKELGADVVEALKVTVPGSKADIRIEKLPLEEAQEEFLFVAPQPVIKRRVIARRKTVLLSEKPKPVKRRLNLKR